MQQKKRDTVTDKIRSALLAGLKSGSLQVGDRYPSVGSLMELYDCSRVTAAASIKQLRSEGLVHTINGSGTYVCPPPRRHKIVLLRPREEDSTFSFENIATHLFLHGAMLACKNEYREYTLIDETYEGFMEHLELTQVVYPSLRGVVLFRGYPHVDEISAVLDKKSIPWMLYGSSHSGFKCSRRLLIDHKAVIESAMDYLCKMGHKRIAFAYYPGHNVHDEAHGHFLNAASARGLRLGPENIASVRDRYGADASASLKPILSLPVAKRPTALLCNSDSIAVHAMNSLYREGVSCPRELSMMSCENTPFSEYTDPALTTIVQPWEEDGARCIKALVEDWSRPKKKIQLDSKIRLVERGSVSNINKSK